MSRIYLARKNQAQGLLEHLLAEDDALWLDLAHATDSSLIAAGADLDRQFAQPTPMSELVEALSNLPTSGLSCGYLAYEACDQATDDRPGPALPLVVLRHYAWHLHLVGDAVYWQGDLPEQGPALAACQAQVQTAAAEPADFRLMASFAELHDRQAYATRFKRIADYLRAGDVYQVNLCRVWRTRFQGDPLRAYQCLRQLSPSEHGGFMRIAGHSLLCRSPERFLRIDGPHVLSSPIKGTVARGPDDAQRQALLAQCEKNRSENLMIVDLMRNDLGRYARLGSVRVEPLFAVRSTAQVHHLVSDIHADLAPDVNAWAFLLSCFPGGSITGAPKRRAREIIRELESEKRSLYCGSLFYTLDGTIEANIAIRTLIAERQGWLWAYAGGGITAGSQEEEEYSECEHKIGAFLATLEQTFLST